MTDKEREPLANIAPFGLRMQPELKDRISASARRNNRSMNAEIVHRLEMSLWLEETGLLHERTPVSDFAGPASGEQILKSLQAVRRIIDNLDAAMDEEDRKDSGRGDGQRQSDPGEQKDE